ncbi:MAG: MBL fold metallo-hydrolase [bacterium]|nr:MBL fold metallo-hydrolase [bacterium]
MNLLSIASGSSGNCIYVGNDETNILIDAGISGKKVIEGLSSMDINPEKLNGLLITHEHSDHIKGVGVLARKYNVPIYATAETINAMLRSSSIGRIKEELLNVIDPDISFMVNDIQVNPFSISHDASNPVGYTFEQDGKKIGLATDLGKYDDYIIKQLTGCNAILIEANHDINMLQVGAYPYILKRRILGDRGHLSNDNSGKLLCSIHHEGLKHIVLGHLSKDNNYPELAFETVKYELQQYKSDILSTCDLVVAKREEPSSFIKL